MGVEQLDGYTQAAVLLITLAGVAVEQVKQMFSAHGVLTNAELNQVITEAETEAARRRDLALGDAGASPI